MALDMNTLLQCDAEVGDDQSKAVHLQHATKG